MKKSSIFQALIRNLEELMTQAIKDHLDARVEKEKLFEEGNKTIIVFDEELEEGTVMSFYPQWKMHSLIREFRDGQVQYILRCHTVVISAEVRDFDIEDHGFVPITDLDFIIDQLDRCCDG
jgi:hypothetical protein